MTDRQPTPANANERLRQLIEMWSEIHAEIATASRRSTYPFPNPELPDLYLRFGWVRQQIDEMVPGDAPLSHLDP